MLHTTIRDAIGNLPIKAVDEKKLPKVDYLALSHLHINYQKSNRIYSGPTFPNNISELEELKGGSFYIYDNGNIKKEYIKIKELFSIHLEITDSLKVTDQLLDLLKNEYLTNKIIIIRLSGILEKGKISDIDFNKIESFLKEKKAYVLLKSTSKLHLAESEVKIELQETEDLEQALIKKFQESNPSQYNSLISSLIKALQTEKLEDETTLSFEDRLITETKKIVQQ